MFFLFVFSLLVTCRILSDFGSVHGSPGSFGTVSGTMHRHTILHRYAISHTHTAPPDQYQNYTNTMYLFSCSWSENSLFLDNSVLTSPSRHLRLNISVSTFLSQYLHHVSISSSWHLHLNILFVSTSISALGSNQILIHSYHSAELSPIPLFCFVICVRPMWCQG